jgi:hypothetical protein
MLTARVYILNDYYFFFEKNSCNKLSVLDHVLMLTLAQKKRYSTHERMDSAASIECVIISFL